MKLALHYGGEKGPVSWVHMQKTEEMDRRQTFTESRTLRTLLHSIHSTIPSGMDLFSHLTNSKPYSQKGYNLRLSPSWESNRKWRGPFWWLRGHKQRLKVHCSNVINEGGQGAWAPKGLTGLEVRFWARENGPSPARDWLPPGASQWRR